MVSKRKMATTAVATFGAAMTSMYAAPELQADIVQLNFSPSSVGIQSTSVYVTVSVGPGIGQFNQWNDGIGKTFFAASGFTVGLVSYSQTLDAGQFFGYTGQAFSASASGTVFIGFNAGGNVGWFGINLGGLGGPVTYTGGQFGDAGESVHVGTVIPEPASATGLAALALGAIGVRRRRK